MKKGVSYEKLPNRRVDLMDILLHIGQSKTGTSAIQAYLTLNRTFLAEQSVLYPSVKVGGMPLDIGNHNALADALLGLSRFPYLTADQYFDAFFTEAETLGINQMILSAEHFFGGEPRIWDVETEDEYFSIYRKKVEKLANFLQGHNVTILVYLRPQVDWIKSAIIQTVRISGLISKKNLYEDDRQFFCMMKPVMKYSQIVKIWDEVIKPQDFIVVPYDRQKLRNESSITDFLSRVQIDKYQFPYGDSDLEINPSFTREYTEVKKIINHSQHSKNSERVIVKCLSWLSERSRFPRHYDLEPELENEIAAFARKENQGLRTRFMSEEQLRMLSPEPSTKQAKRCPSDAEIAYALKLFNQMYKGPIGRFLIVDYTIRDLLRRRSPGLHSLIHQVKRYTRQIKHRA